MEANIYDDCWELVQCFQRLINEGEKCEFEVFCRCWRELNMQHLYTAQSNNIEIVATTLAALHLAKQLACSRRTNGDFFKATRCLRVAGFYLLYVIYNKQPTHQFVKIEVAQRTWQELTDYVLLLRQESPDKLDSRQVAYMFWRLVNEQAFRFTALDYSLGLDDLVDYKRLETKMGAKQQKKNDVLLKQQRPNSVSLIYELDGFRTLHLATEPFCDLETAYNERKKRLAGQELALPPTKIFTQLREAFGDIQRLLGEESDKEQKEQDEPPMSSKNQLEVRQQVRYKALYGKEQNEDTRQGEEVELGASEAYQRRMSSATVFQHPLPEEVEREYMINDSTDDCEENKIEENLTNMDDNEQNETEKLLRMLEEEDFIIESESEN